MTPKTPRTLIGGMVMIMNVYPPKYTLFRRSHAGAEEKKEVERFHHVNLRDKICMLNRKRKGIKKRKRKVGLKCKA